MKPLRRQWGIALLAFLIIPVAGRCQEHKDKPAQHSADGPGPVHKQMESLAGSWDVEVAYVLGGKENKGKARCEARWILDGRFLEQEYKSNFQGKPFTVLQILGYDNQKKKTIELMLDNLSTTVLHNEGTISEDGKVISNEGESLDRASGKTEKLRTVYTIIDQDHFTLEWFRPAEGGKEEKVVSMTHTRRKP